MLPQPHWGQIQLVLCGLIWALFEEVEILEKNDDHQHAQRERETEKK